MAPRDEVLGLPELLENILGHLPMRDLLLAQRVSKTWQAVIQLKPLQRALFFEEISGGPLKFVHTAVTSPFQDLGDPDIMSMIEDMTEYNSQVYHPDGSTLVQEANLEYMWTTPKQQVPDDADANDVANSDLSADTYTTEEVEEDRYPISIYENPVLLELHSQLNSRVTSTQTLASLPETWNRPEASWRRMLITSPSTVKTRCNMMVMLDVECVVNGYGGTGTQFPRLLGTLFDEFEEQCGPEEKRYASYDIEKGIIMDGVRMEIRGREMWEVPRDQGWNRVKDGEGAAALWEYTTYEMMFHRR